MHLLVTHEIWGVTEQLQTKTIEDETMSHIVLEKSQRIIMQKLIKV